MGQYWEEETLDQTFTGEGPGDGSPVEADPVADYKPQEARALIRERVRRFNGELMALKNERLDEGRRRESSIDTIVRLRSLSAYRLKAFSLLVFLPLLISLAVTVLEGFGPEGMLPGWVESTTFAVFVSGAAFVGGVLLAVVALWAELATFKNQSQERLHTIDRLITERMSDLQQQYGSALGKLKVQISNSQSEIPHKQAIIDMFMAWRELDRLPNYIRHDFTEYFSEVNDNRQHGRGRTTRLILFFGFILVAALGLWVSVRLIMGPGSGENGPVGAEGLRLLVQIGLLVQVVFCVSAFFLYRHRHPVWETCKLAIFGAGGITLVLAMTSGTPSEGYGAFSTPMTKFLAWNMALMAVSGLIAVWLSGQVYKRHADRLIVDLVRSLKAHKKTEVVGLTIREFKDWKEPTQGAPDEWNGWKPGYEKELRARLQQEGKSDDEIDIIVGCDPVIYVGNEKNRRLVAAETDIVSSFAATLPVVFQ